MEELDLAILALESIPDDIEFDSVLLGLGHLVSTTANDEYARVSFNQQSNVIAKLRSCFNGLFYEQNDTPISSYYYRTLRGILLLVRNISSLKSFCGEDRSVGPDSVLLLFRSIVESLLRFDPQVAPPQVPLLQAYLETLANMSQAMNVADINNCDSYEKPSTILELDVPSAPKGLIDSINEDIIVEEQNVKDMDIVDQFDFEVDNKQTTEPISDYLAKVIDEKIQYIQGNGDQLDHPLILLVQNFLSHRNGNFAHLILSNRSILDYLINQFHLVDTDSDLSDIHETLLGILQTLVTHERFNTYLKLVYNYAGIVDEDETSRILITSTLQTCQLVVTSRDNWNDQQLVAMLSWIHDNFVLFAAKSKQILPISKQNINLSELNFIHANIVAILDCLSDLGKFETTRQYLENYGALAELIELLRYVHENIPRKTLKTKKIEDINELANEKKFPQVKSLIIEIISYLAHENKKVQDSVRDLHGLELVLSNCMIDENEPYVKERAIICIKILLHQNQENQTFVASLEAKNTVDDEALKEVGYEVEIKDGKVGLKKANT